MFNLFTNLHLFDATGGEGAGEGASSATQGETNGIPGNTRRGKSGDKYNNVVFGKQEVTEATEPSQVAAADTDVKVTSNTLEDRKKAFQDLIRGEYKDEYTQETQRMIDRRFKETKQLQEKLDQSQPLMDMLFGRYGIEDGDISKLTKAIEEDDAYWELAADEAGMSVSQFKEFQKLRQENAVLSKIQEEQKRNQFAEQQAEKWYQEAEAVKAKYPKFDLAAELNNREFVSMIQARTPMEHAYKVMHLDDIVSDAVQVTQATTEKNLTENIRAKGNRPLENGTTSQSAFTVKDDVSKLTKEDRREIARRVARGEIIQF